MSKLRKGIIIGFDSHACPLSPTAVDLSRSTRVFLPVGLMMSSVKAGMIRTSFWQRTGYLRHQHSQLRMIHFDMYK